MAAAGQVTTGFSKPYVALYSAAGGVVTYSDGQLLARGVEVSVEPESSDDNNFYADNIVAETAAGTFTGGTVSLTVDGLFIAAERLIMGYGAADGDGWTAVKAGDSIPYVAIGFICRTQSEGTVYYTPYIIPKASFQSVPIAAATQEDEIDWQTTELTATILRDDTADQNWKFIGTAQSTEAAAETALQAKLGI